MNGRVLAISWALPPLVVPRALQVSRLLAQTSALGWPATVIAVDPAALKGSLPLDLELEKAYQTRYERVPVGSPERHLALRGLFRLAPFLKQMPDETRLWANRAYHRAKALMARKKFSVLVSFAQPWSSHMVGLRLHHETGIPWIAHFSDPWVVGSHAKMSWWAARQAAYWEAHVIRSATRLIFVTPEARDATLARYPAELKQKAHVIPHGYDRDVLKLINPPIPPKKETLTLVHSGNFYGARSPESFLKALAELHQATPLTGVLDVRFVGFLPPDFAAAVERLGVGSIVRSLGPRSYREALQEMQNADVLLLIEAASQTNMYFPSKLVDYLLFEKPILGLTPSEGSSAALLRQLDCPVVTPDDVPGIRNQLLRLLDQKRAGTLKVSGNFPAIAHTFDIKNTAKPLVELLQSVTS